MKCRMSHHKSESGCDSQQPEMQGLLCLLFIMTEYADC